MNPVVSNKRILSGNEAVALGAWEAGVKAAYSYPGTPATEILEAFSHHGGRTARWAVNEKVALENAIGVSLSGARALCSMKHVGLNVAADPLFVSAYIGVEGGLVIVTADDPGIHSSQNEQDNRHFARAAKLPMLEPSDSEEARKFTVLAYEISEKFNTPVLLRLTTRIAHSKSLVSVLGEPREPSTARFESKPSRYVMIPTYAREQHKRVEKNLENIAHHAEELECNRLELGDKRLGIVTSGIAYQYCKETVPDASFLKLGMVHPLPSGLLKKLSDEVGRLVVVEELDPFLETELKALGLKVEGKSLFPTTGELSPDIVAERLGNEARPVHDAPKLAPRPPALCPGCPYTGFFYTLKKLNVIVDGDIGCYTLASLPPLSAIDTTLCMGAGIAMAQGMEDAGVEQRTIAVIGDSTFCHAGMPALLNAISSGYNTKIAILDNGTTAMTGLQPTPTSHAPEEGTPRLDIAQLVGAMGVSRGNLAVIGGYDLKNIQAVLEEQFERDGVSVIVLKEPCQLLPEAKAARLKPLVVDSDACTGCESCLQLGCPAIRHDNGKAQIIVDICTGCGVCATVCPTNAIQDGDL